MITRRTLELLLTIADSGAFDVFVSFTSQSLAGAPAGSQFDDALQDAVPTPRQL
jgi:hypothetical protein